MAADAILWLTKSSDWDINKKQGKKNERYTHTKGFLLFF
jgi:hypothetical protein